LIISAELTRAGAKAVRVLGLACLFSPALPRSRRRRRNRRHGRADSDFADWITTFDPTTTNPPRLACEPGGDHPLGPISSASDM